MNMRVCRVRVCGVRGCVQLEREVCGDSKYEL